MSTAATASRAVALVALVVLAGWRCEDAPDDPDDVPGPALAPLPSGSLGPGFTDLDVLGDDDPDFSFAHAEQSEAPDAPGALVDLLGDGRVWLVTGNRRVVALPYDRETRRFGARAPLPGVPSALAVLDLDGDHVADVVPAIAGSVARDIAWGRGDGTFAPAPLGPAVERLIWGTAAVVDLDADGWLDLLLGRGDCCDGSCTDLIPMQRTGLRTYTPRVDWLPADGDPSRASMVFAFDFHPGELVLGALGNRCAGNAAPGFYRQDGRDARGEPRFVPFDPVPANARFRRGETMSINFVAPMGGAVADLDGDGWPDFRVSGEKACCFFRTTAAWPWAERSRTADVLEASVLRGGGRPTPWGTTLLDIDGDGTIDHVTASGNDAAEDITARPTQFSTVHLGVGGFRFVDASAAARFDRPGQWRDLAYGDLDGDGDVDYVLGGHGMAPRVFRNDIDRGFHRLALRLRGTTSNHLGVGARVWVRAAPGGPEQLLVSGGTFSPLVVSEPLLFAGLGRSAVADRVRIEWPSGYAQELTGLAAEALHTVTEPETIAVEPAGRHLPAGSGVAVLRVTPRGPDGAVRPGARVEVTVAADAAAVEGPAAQPDGSWVARVTAPARAGSSVVVVRVDGVEARVRPRLWWD